MIIKQSPVSHVHILEYFVLVHFSTIHDKMIFFFDERMNKSS